MNLMEFIVLAYLVSIGFVIVTGALSTGDGVFLPTDFNSYVPSSVSGNISLLYGDVSEYNTSAAEGLSNIDQQNTESEGLFTNDLYTILYNGTVSLFKMGQTLLTAPLIMIDIIASFFMALFSPAAGVVASLVGLAKGIFIIITLYVLVWGIILGRPL
jgi:hypothetical protein